MIFKFKHGDFEADLNICNRAYRMAIMQAELSGIDLFAGSNLANANFLMDYAYHCYAVEFARNGVKPPLDLIAFDEIVSESQKESNYVELMEALSNSVVSILSKLTKEVEESEQKSEKKTASKARTS